VQLVILAEHAAGQSLAVKSAYAKTDCLTDSNVSKALEFDYRCSISMNSISFVNEVVLLLNFERYVVI